MDCPDLPSAEVRKALETTAYHGQACIYPSDDGGYVMISLPADVNAPSAFDGVRWSACDTCESQLGVLEAMGLTVLRGACLSLLPPHIVSASLDSMHCN